ncbi:MAG: PEP-CTERM sorting domain-containing protein [Methylophilus sp.]|nr:PEP-CTERM sorting domain-containing protein [Methylophilus sp.]
MKVQLKSLVLAIVLATPAFSANALIQSTLSGNGNTELVFSAWVGDNDAGTGYVYDLNWNKYIQDFIGTDLTPNTANNTTIANQALNSTIAVGANGIIFDDVLTGLPFASVAGVQWALTAVDAQGRVRELTTRDVTDSSGQVISSDGVKNSSTVMTASQYTNWNLLMVDQSFASDSYAVSSAADTISFAGWFGPNLNNKFFDTTNLFGATSNLYMSAQTTQAASNAASIYVGLKTAAGQDIVAKTYQGAGGEWRLQIAAVTAVTAVPEPETYAMLLAGLGLMGFSARRKNK